MDVSDIIKVKKFTKEKAEIWLHEIGLAVSGSKEELINRIIKYKRYLKLVKKLKSKAKRNYTFPCSLDPTSIPSPNACWRVNDKKLPVVSKSTFMSYAAQKKEGSQGQQEKAFRMLQSRKICTVKVLSDEDQSQIFVKAMIKKSYGHVSRPAVIIFKDGCPVQAHCNCPVGPSGLCCHVLALLLFLKHFHESGEKILELTCTQQLQTWHKRTGRGSIPMVPLKEI